MTTTEEPPQLYFDFDANSRIRHDPHFGLLMTLAEARDTLRGLVDVGYPCPCCDQLAKVYKRPIGRSNARDLLNAFRRHGIGEWFHFQSLPGKIQNGGDTGKLRFWGLVDEQTEILRDDGGRCGYWQITTKGRAWLLGQISVPKYARIYDGKLLELTGRDWTIRDAMGKDFRLDEIMESGAAER